jgi:hypothetical protein
MANFVFFHYFIYGNEIISILEIYKKFHMRAMNLKQLVVGREMLRLFISAVLIL